MEEENPGENAENQKTDETEDNEASSHTDVDNKNTEEEEVEHEETEGEIKEEIEGKHVEGKVEELGEHEETEPKAIDEALDGEEQTGEERLGEELEEEALEGEATTEEEKKKEQTPVEEELVEEEEAYVEEPPPDPTAPYDLTDSKEALKPPFELRPDQVVEVEQLWELYQNYTPAYTNIDGFITVKELIYMLKCLLLMTYTPEQLQELIAFCVRPPHPEGHITYEQFLKMVTIRQREFPVEEELRSALQVLDPGKTGSIDREYMKELLAKQGHKMSQKQLDNLMKEVDIANDGTIGIEDVVGTMCIDLNRDDIIMLQNALNSEEQPPPAEEEM